MPSSIKGNVRINIRELEILVKHLLILKNTLDRQKHQIPALKTRLTSAITGTAPNIATFDRRFASWMGQLDTVITDMDRAYYTLSTVLEEAREHELAEVIEVLRGGRE